MSAEAGNITFFNGFYKFARLEDFDRPAFKGT